MKNRQGFEYNSVMKRYPNECDMCSNPMSREEFDVAVSCVCGKCLPWVVCKDCHKGYE